MPSTHDPFDMNEYTEADMYEKSHHLQTRNTADGLRGYCSCLSTEAIEVIGSDQSAGGAIRAWYAGHLARALVANALTPEAHSSGSTA